MLKELRSRRPQTRWFTDDYLELFVWLDGEEVAGYQLCYDRTRAERCITFRSDGSFEHSAIDDGESDPTHNRAPELIDTADRIDPRVLLQEFQARSGGLPAEITQGLTARLAALL
jgi:hypothetical protein